MLFSPMSRYIQSALFVFIILTNICFAQTAKRQVVPGTKYSLIPPKGFVPASGFTGFQNTTLGASIVVAELPVGVDDMAVVFTYDSFKAKGMEITDRQAIQFHNSQALYLHVRQQVNGNTILKQMLVFGDKDRTAIINGIYPAEKKEIAGAMKTALMSTKYNENAKASPLAAAGFSIDIKDSPFRFAKSIAGMLMYSVDGNVPSTKPILIAGNSMGRIATVRDQKKYSVDRLKKMPGAEASVVKETNPITIDNLKGYEIIAEGADKELIYMVMLYTAASDFYYLIYGSANEEQEHYLPQYRAIVKTFKRK